MTIIQDSNKFGSLDKNELKQFELKYGISLPADYRAFLIENNGGDPFGYIEPIMQTDIQWIYGLHRGEYWASLYYIAEELLEGQIPNKLLPIANDSGGNFFVLSMREEDYSKLYFWDHEEELEEDRSKWFKILHPVANSFTEFINGFIKQ
jgi:hypothetical protein